MVEMGWSCWTSPCFGLSRVASKISGTVAGFVLKGTNLCCVKLTYSLGTLSLRTFTSSPISQFTGWWVFLLSSLLVKMVGNPKVSVGYNFVLKGTNLRCVKLTYSLGTLSLRSFTSSPISHFTGWWVFLLSSTENQCFMELVLTVLVLQSVAHNYCCYYLLCMRSTAIVLR